VKIYFLITNLSGGGAEKSILRIATALHSQGYSAGIILLENKIEYDIPFDLDITILTKRISRGWLGKRILAYKLRKQFISLDCVIISTLPFSDEIASLSRLENRWCRISNSLIGEIRQLALTNPRKSKRRLRRYERIYRGEKLIALSSEMADELKNNFSPRRIEIIPNFFDFFTIRHAALEASARPKFKYAIHVGRFNKQKRHDILLNAWASKKVDCPLILLTHKNELLEKMIAERGLSEKVTIAGFQKNPYPWIAGAELLVVSSDYEGLPNVIIEALICGTPVVSTDCPSGSNEILAAMPECLAKTGDSIDLSSKIDYCLSIKPKIDKIDLSPYDQKNVMKKYLALIRE